MKKITILILLILILSGCEKVELDGQDDGIILKRFKVGGENVFVGGTERDFGAEVDLTQETFKPEVKLQKWGDETHIRVWSDEKGDKKARQKGNKIVWENEDKSREYNFYPLTPEEMENKDGGFEYEIILKKKPKTNIISLNIDLNNVKCYYQPPLNEEVRMGDGGVVGCTETDCYDKNEKNIIHRPEKIVGSYVCYHENKKGDYTALGGKNYMTGQIGIFYRPKMCDSDDWCIWGQFNSDMNETGILTNVIPQDFLDSASYPIYHAIGDTFGYETAGGSSTSLSDDIRGSHDTPAGEGEVTKMTAYTDRTFSATTFKCLLVEDSGKTIISNGITDGATVPSSPAWTDDTFGTNPTITASKYWVGAIMSSSGDGKLFYNSGGSNSSGYDGTNSYTSPTDPTDGDYTGGLFLSVYATYSAAASPAVADDPARQNIIWFD